MSNASGRSGGGREVRVSVSSLLVSLRIPTDLLF